MARKPDMSFLHREPARDWGGTSCDDGVMPMLPAWWEMEQKYLGIVSRRVTAARLGPPGGRNRGPVLYECLDHPEWGKIDADAMAERLGVQAKTVRNAAPKHYRVAKQRVVPAGERWRGAQPPERKTNRSTKRRPVISDKYGWFPSSAAASRFLKLNPSAVAISIYNGHECGGTRWRWATESERPVAVDKCVDNCTRTGASAAPVSLKQPKRRRRAA